MTNPATNTRGYRMQNARFEFDIEFLYKREKVAV
jgi:hypothetical protein